MSLAPFVERAADSASSLLPTSGRAEFLEQLAGTTVQLDIGGQDSESAAEREAFLLAVNLAVRLYPRLVVRAPADLRTAAISLAQSINPAVDLGDEAADAVLSFSGEPDHMTTTVRTDGWNVVVDSLEPQIQPPVAEAALAGAAIGVANLFRTVFRGRLPNGRHAAEPGLFNLVAGRCERSEIPASVGELDVAGLAIVGAGAIGQAAALTLGLHPLSGDVTVVDPERVDLGNLQRYVLAGISDLGSPKARMAATQLRKAGAEVAEVPVTWAESGLAERMVDTAMIGLDTAEDRVGVQAGLPRKALNAWTQPADVGWSRHEAFGRLPCVACLYWPSGRQLSLDQQIAGVLSLPIQRVRLYLVSRTPVGQPLPEQVIQANSLAVPKGELERWASTSLLSDLVNSERSVREVDEWTRSTLEELYREGVCGGALVFKTQMSDERLLVPAAFQSALAGVMLAAQYVIAQDERLRLLRGSRVEHRLDLLRGLPQEVARPRSPRRDCMCCDRDFVDAYQARWSQ